jgi:hypothetical protein
MLGLIAIHLFVGALLGFRFTVFVVIPIAAATLIEAILLQPVGSWSSMVWRAAVLIVAIEVGYILGAVLRGIRLGARISNSPSRQSRGSSRSKRSNPTNDAGSE